MTNKIQMTEEQARGIIECIFGTAFEFVENDGIVYIQRLRENGYIIKSELQQKVEEAEDDYDNYVKNFIDIESDDRNELIEDLYKLVQLLKQSHPEFKEK